MTALFNFKGPEKYNRLSAFQFAHRTQRAMNSVWITAGPRWLEEYSYVCFCDHAPDMVDGH